VVSASSSSNSVPGWVGKLLVALVVLYWVMSVPAVARGLQTAHEGRTTDVPAALPAEPLPIVVLGNGLGGYSAFGGRVEVPLEWRTIAEWQDDGWTVAQGRYRFVLAQDALADGPAASIDLPGRRIAK